MWQAFGGFLDEVGEGMMGLGGYEGEDHTAQGTETAPSKTVENVSGGSPPPDNALVVDDGAGRASNFRADEDAMSHSALWREISASEKGAGRGDDAQMSEIAHSRSGEEGNLAARIENLRRQIDELEQRQRESETLRLDHLQQSDNERRSLSIFQYTARSKAVASTGPPLDHDPKHPSSRARVSSEETVTVPNAALEPPQTRRRKTAPPPITIPSPPSSMSEDASRDFSGSCSIYTAPLLSDSYSGEGGLRGGDRMLNSLKFYDRFRGNSDILSCKRKPAASVEAVDAVAGVDEGLAVGESFDDPDDETAGLRRPSAQHRAEVRWFRTQFGTWDAASTSPVAVKESLEESDTTANDPSCPRGDTLATADEKANEQFDKEDDFQDPHRRAAPDGAVLEQCQTYLEARATSTDRQSPDGERAGTGASKANIAEDPFVEHPHIEHLHLEYALGDAQATVAVGKGRKSAFPPMLNKHQTKGCNEAASKQHQPTQAEDPRLTSTLHDFPLPLSSDLASPMRGPSMGLRSIDPELMQHLREAHNRHIGSSEHAVASTQSWPMPFCAMPKLVYPTGDHTAAEGLHLRDDDGRVGSMQAVSTVGPKDGQAEQEDDGA